MKRNNALIIGGGISGFGAARLSNHIGYNTYVTSIDKIEKDKKQILTDLGIKFEEGKHTVSHLNNKDLIIKSPGVSPKIPLLIEAQKRQIPILSEIEFAFTNTDSYIIAVTGTNGKTTTAKLIYHILNRAGLNVDLVGNIGKSFSESVLAGKCSYYVVETSSFQLENIITFKPDISIILNIDNDHLNRYGNDFECYLNTKLRIQMNQTEDDACIYFSHDSSIHSKLKNSTVKKYLFGDSKINNHQYGGWLEKDQIIINTIKNNFTMTIHNLALQGSHNLYNSMAAAIAASTIGIKNEIIKASLSDFKGLEHRLEFVGKISGVDFINDSKATNCNSVYYALDSVNSPIIWICGGVDKGNDYTSLKTLVSNKVKSIIYLGHDAEKIQSNFTSCVKNIKVVSTMSEAVNYSYSIAHPGDTVLLSPSCASFDLFKDYKERGRVFKSCVLSI
tara:strand:+ start:1037 stop:2377 length:1341 start_codon:yes stop_codon:yes gene_type:complete